MRRAGTAAQSDERLLTLMRANDIGAFNLIYEKYWDPLNHLASHYLNDSDAGKEVVQDLFINLYVKRLELNIRFSLSAYLHASLHNKMLNYQRNKSVYKRHVETAGRLGKSTDNDVQRFIDQSDLESRIGQYINNLPGRYREVYFLYREKGFKVREIALLLKRPANTVDKQLRKILSLLRSYLRDYR